MSGTRYSAATASSFWSRPQALSPPHPPFPTLSVHHSPRSPPFLFTTPSVPHPLRSPPPSHDLPPARAPLRHVGPLRRTPHPRHVLLTVFRHYGASPSMPMANPGMPTAVPYDHQPTYPIAYPQPPSPSYIPSNTTYAGDSGYLAPPPMGPRPQTPTSTYAVSPHSGTYDYSRSSTPYSAMVAGSEHSHGAPFHHLSVSLGLTYCLDVWFTPQLRAPSMTTQATNVNGGSKPRPTKPPKPSTKTKRHGQPGNSHASGCCIIM